MIIFDYVVTSPSIEIDVSCKKHMISDFGDLIDFTGVPTRKMKLMQLYPRTSMTDSYENFAIPVASVCAFLNPDNT